MSLHNAALCVSLNVRQTRMRKMDIPTTKMVHELRKAKPGSAKVWKELYTRSHRVTVESPVGELRKFINAISHEWVVGVMRIVPTTLYEENKLAMATLREDVLKAQTHFCESFDDFQRDGENHLGDMYDYSDYPKSHNVADDFHCKIDVCPVPISMPANILHRLIDEEMETDKDEIRRIIMEQEADNLKRVTVSCAERVCALTHELVSKIDEKQTGKKTGSGRKKTYRDSAIGHIWDLVQILPQLNLAQAPEIDALHRALKTDILAKLDLDSIQSHERDKRVSVELSRMRENTDLENTVKAEARKIMDMASAILPEPEED